MPYKAIFENRSPAFQLFLLGILSFACLFLSSFLFALLLIPFYGISIVANLQSIMDFSNPATIQVLKFMQLVNTLGAFMAPPILLAFLCSSNPLAYLSSRIPKKLPFILPAIFILIVCSQPLINFCVELNAHLDLPNFLSDLEHWMKKSEDEAAELTKAFLRMNSFGDLLFNFLVIAFFPAIGEELFFRGAFQKLFFRLTKNIHLGIWLAAILFSAIHFQFYGFIPRMLLGALLGYLLYWTGSIWISVWAHFVNNGMAVLFEYFIQKGNLSEDVENIGTTDNQYVWVLSSVFLVIGLLFLIYRNRTRAEELNNT